MKEKLEQCMATFDVQKTSNFIFHAMQNSGEDAKVKLNMILLGWAAQVQNLMDQQNDPNSKLWVSLIKELNQKQQNLCRLSSEFKTNIQILVNLHKLPFSNSPSNLLCSFQYGDYPIYRFPDHLMKAQSYTKLHYRPNFLCDLQYNLSVVTQSLELPNHTLWFNQGTCMPALRVLFLSECIDGHQKFDDLEGHFVVG